MAIVDALKVNAQIMRGDEPAIGPGKAMVLEAIDQTGSISAAGRCLGMSYRRIWLLVERLNSDWAEPVVETRVGGGRSGGARMTAFGIELLAHYRAMESAMVQAAAGVHLDWMKERSRQPDSA